MYDRLLHIDENSPSSAFIFGPRGTGKTHWLKQHYPDSLYFDLLHGDMLADLAANPSKIEARIPTDYKGWVIIDEIQKVPELLNEVHRLIEHQGRRFILTGSSVRSLRRRGVNLLAGRAFIYHMHPLTAEELGESFSLERAIRYGMLPACYISNNPSTYLDSYVQTYLKEEVQQEALTRNLALFTRFLQSASFCQGEVLNYTAIARDLGANRQTVCNFFDILDDLLIGKRLHTFTRRAQRSVVTQPKFYYFDTGVFQNIRPTGPLDTVEEIMGAALETLFLQNASALNDYFRWGYEFYYWRTHSQHEVDFILYGERGLHALEIKRKQQLGAKDLRGLKLFKQDYPMANCKLLYGGTRRYWDHDIEIIPYEEALLTLTDLLG